MFRVIVVDDELWIRKGIINAIDWKCHGFTVIGEYGDGEEAYEQIQKDIPDLLIMDMRMPGLDGRELIRELHQQFPELIVVVLSGYSDFEYTSQAIKYNAFDYLLKPLKKEELTKVLFRAKQELIEKREKTNRQQLVEDEQLNKQLIFEKENVNDVLLHHKKSRNGDGVEIVEKIIKRIEQDYSKALSLYKIANEYFINPDYLSRLFKKETNQNFVDYLTSFRLEKSKELLMNGNYKNYEIAEMVGYDNYRYFSQIFKKKMGMTIGEFKQTHKVKEKIIAEK